MSNGTDGGKSRVIATARGSCKRNAALNSVKVLLQVLFH
jgi:hypothetical protein